VSFVRGGKRYATCPTPCPRAGQSELRRERAKSYGDALKILNARRTAVDKGEGLPITDAVTFEELMERLATDHATKHRKAALKLKHLRAAFAGKKAPAITYDAMQRYVIARQALAADSTIRQELSNLRRGFRLAKQAGRLTAVPAFPMPEVKNTIEGYFTPAELARLLTLLPPWLSAAAAFAAYTGWRAGNVFGLRWEHVDLKHGSVRAPTGTTKSGKALVRHFEIGSDLSAILRQQERTHGPKSYDRVFEKRDLRTAWSRAVGETGLDKFLDQFDPRGNTVTKVRPTFHTLRHSFRQHMGQAGVDETSIMEMGGWLTRSTFDRYFDADEQAQRAAAKRQETYLKAERAKVVHVIDLKRRKSA
jgi:integrase